MSKPIIIVGAYCPDDERIQLLENCINSLQPIKSDFDILISSHSYIPEYIAKKVDYVFYDKNNELLKDWDYINLPWFSPFEGTTIVSALISNYSTYLAVYRVVIGALGIAKNFNYKKAHYIEYDSVINDYTDLYENNTLLDNYVAVQYTKDQSEFDAGEAIAVWGYGCFQSINLEKINPVLTSYNKETLLNMLKDTRYKTNEKITQEMLLLDGEKIFFKNLIEIENKNNKFNLSSNIQENNLNDWTIPFYDSKTNKINVIAWNSKKEHNINVNFIINKEKIITLSNVSKSEWRILEVDYIDNVNEILIIVDNKIKDHIIIDTFELKEKFKRNSEARYSNL